MRPPYAAIMHYTLCAAAGIAILTVVACGGSGTSGEQPAASLSVTSVDSGTSVRSGALLSGLEKIAIAGTGTDVSGISATFIAAQEEPQPLVPDQANPGQFWLPIVMARTAGTLSISVRDHASTDMPLTLAPFPAPDVPGVATRDFLQDSLSNSNAALKDMLLAGQRLPALLQPLNRTTELTQQQLNWVTSAMQNGTATMATLKNGTPVRMTIDDLKALDQMALRTEALRTNRSAAPLAANPSPWIKIIDFLMPSALAQTTDTVAFISSTRATSDALGLTANLVPGSGGTGAGAFRRSADVEAIALSMAGLYAAHYGNALATIQVLPNHTFAEPVDEGQTAVIALLAGVLNEIVMPDLSNLTQDSTVSLIGEFTASIDNAAVENILTDKVMIFRTRNAGIRLCPPEEQPVADQDVDFVRCVSL